jgi:hypothetical protein
VPINCRVQLAGTVSKGREMRTRFDGQRIVPALSDARYLSSNLYRWDVEKHPSVLATREDGAHARRHTRGQVVQLRLASRSFGKRA